MAAEPVPVTFHVRAEARPELVARHRPRPYRPVAQAVGMLSAMGVLFGYMAGAYSPPRTSPAAPAATAMAPSTPAREQAAAARIADLPAPVPAPRPQTPPRSAAAAAPASPTASAPPGDPTPVATIEQRRRGFARGERAPDYSGLKVIAGH